MNNHNYTVASFTDAWIETFTMLSDYTDVKSHLLQMRGLKPKTQIIGCQPPEVASFTDAWIETRERRHQYQNLMSHLLQMRGLKLTIKNKRIITSVASFTDAWIETGAYQHL